MRSSISAKIPKRSETAFPNRESFTLICLLAVVMEAIFRLQLNRRLMQPRDEQGGEGESGGRATGLLGSVAILF
jgi:hypothetical protein